MASHKRKIESEGTKGRLKKRRKTGPLPEDLDPQRYWAIKDIVGETETEYLIDWEDNPITGELYQPTWEPKANANKGAVADWKSRHKAQAGTDDDNDSAEAHSIPMPSIVSNNKRRTWRRRRLKLMIDSPTTVPSPIIPPDRPSSNIHRNIEVPDKRNNRAIISQIEETPVARNFMIEIPFHQGLDRGQYLDHSVNETIQECFDLGPQQPGSPTITQRSNLVSSSLASTHPDNNPLLASPLKFDPYFIVPDSQSRQPTATDDPAILTQLTFIYPSASHSQAQPTEASLNLHNLSSPPEFSVSECSPQQQANNPESIVPSPPSSPTTSHLLISSPTISLGRALHHTDSRTPYQFFGRFLGRFRIHQPCSTRVHRQSRQRQSRSVCEIGSTKGPPVPGYDSKNRAKSSHHFRACQRLRGPAEWAGCGSTPSPGLGFQFHPQATTRRSSIEGFGFEPDLRSSFQRRSIGPFGFGPHPSPSPRKHSILAVRFELHPRPTPGKRSSWPFGFKPYPHNSPHTISFIRRPKD